jgi:hypothetical protein
VQPVLGLVEDERRRRLEDLVGHLERLEAVLRVDLPAHLGLGVVEGREAVEDLRLGVARQRQHPGVHLVGQQQLDPLGPGLLRLPHRQPDVGGEHVAAADGLGDVLGDRDSRTGLGGDRARERQDLARGRQRPRARDPDVHRELGPADEVGIGHVEAGVAQVAERDLVEGLRHVLPDREEVGQDLRRVPLVGQPVVDRHAGPPRELLGGVLAEAAVLDRVVHAAEHARRVLHRLLVADVRARGADERDVGALVVGGDLERAARAGRVLLEDQRDLLAGEALLLASLALRRLELGRQVEQVRDLRRRVLGEARQVPAVQVDRRAHRLAPLLARSP